MMIKILPRRIAELLGVIDDTKEVMRQVAPYPKALESLVGRISYKSNWKFTLADVDRGQGSEGLTLCCLIETEDSYEEGKYRRVMHYMIPPPAAFDEREWQAWLMDQVILIETHEAMEFFKIDGKRPYAPNHGPGRNPYRIHEKGTFKDAATQFTGEQRKPEAKD